jgi:Uma2 family endonuclease
MVQKRVEYEQAGVKELWVIDQPRKRLSVFDLDDNGRFVKRKIQGNRLSARTVPGFRIQIDWLWCEPRQFPSTVSIVQDLLRG